MQRANQIEFNHQIKTGKKELEAERIELARLKSLENVRLRKFKEKRKALTQEFKDKKRNYED